MEVAPFRRKKPEGGEIDAKGFEVDCSDRDRAFPR